MSQKSTVKPKFLRTFGKKPRASKTSKRMHYKGFDFFLHRSSAETGGQIMLYWDRIPYPYISLIIHDKEQMDEITVQKWIDLNLDKIIDVFQKLDEFVHIPKDIMKKMNQKKYTYEILDKLDRSKKYRLVVHKHEDDFVYLWCNPNDAPTKAHKGKQILDTDVIYKEYLKRKEINE